MKHHKFVVGAVLAVALLATGCRVNQNNLSSADKLSPMTVFQVSSTTADIAYGPDIAQKLDVYLPQKPVVGTMMFLHSGGWMAGGKESVAALVMAELNRGWAVVSVGYRLTPTARAPQITSDVDRAIRFVKANGPSLGLKIKPLVITGGSAGGHLALMAAVAPGLDVDQTMPAELRAQSPNVDAVVSLSGPTDLATLWKGVWIAPEASEKFLGCTQAPVAVVPGTPVCSIGMVRRYSPLFWVQQANATHKALPPLYLGAGSQDQLVVSATQSDVLYSYWSANGRDARTWYDITPNAGHNVDFELNFTAFNAWADRVLSGKW